VLKEFQKFITRGNVVDLAVGIVVGSAFTGVVRSLVDDVLMPPIGVLTGGVDFSNLFVDLSGHGYPSVAAAKQAGAATLNYGLFLNSLISFLIVAVAVFALVQVYQRLRTLAEPPAPDPERECPQCLMPVSRRARRCAHCTSELQPA
jgi:large conductance mechanosensitive channel